MSLHETISRAVKDGVLDSQVQIKLCIIDSNQADDQFDNRTRVYGANPNDKDVNPKIFDRHRRLNIKVFENGGLVPYASVPVYKATSSGKNATNDMATLPAGESLAIVAFIGKNSSAESAIILSFIDPAFDQQLENGKIAGQAQSVSTAKTVSNSVSVCV